MILKTVTYVVSRNQLSRYPLISEYETSKRGKKGFDKVLFYSFSPFFLFTRNIFKIIRLDLDRFASGKLVIFVF